MTSLQGQGRLRIAGYAAVFDHPDSGGDVVRRGAFASTRKGGLPLLSQHDARRRIGTVDDIGSRPI